MILDELRAATRELHEQTEQNMPLMRPDFSRDDYQALIGCFWGFIKPLNDQIYRRNEWFDLSENWAARLEFNRIAALESDWDFFAPKQSLAKTFSLCQDVPEVSEFSQVVGCAYVLEGSTLGGQIIARHLKEKFGLESGWGATYFSAYGAQTGLRWREFCNTLELYEVSLSDVQRNWQKSLLIKAACDTFECLGQWLTRD